MLICKHELECAEVGLYQLIKQGTAMWKAALGC